MDVNTPAVLTDPQKTPLQGIRGWLILPMLGLFYMLYQTIIMMYLDILQVKSAWHLVTNEQSDFYVDGFSNAFYMLQMAQGILIVLLAWNVIAALKGLKIAKPLFIISMLFYTVMVVVSRFVFPNIFGIEIEYSYKARNQTFIRVGCWVSEGIQCACVFDNAANVVKRHF